MLGAIHPLPHTPPWRGSQLNKSQVQLYHCIMYCITSIIDTALLRNPGGQQVLGRRLPVILELISPAYERFKVPQMDRDIIKAGII